MMMKRIFAAAAALLAAFTLSAEDITLSNGKVSLSFAAEKEFAVKSFIVDGVNRLPQGGSTTPVWMMTYLGPNGESPVLQPRWGFYDGGSLAEDGRSAEFTWRMVIEKEAIWPVKVKVSLEEDSELPLWSISAELPEGWVVSELEFPRLSVARLDGAKGIMPVGYGAEYGIPNDGLIQSRYPSCTGTMEMVLMHNGSKTVYFAADDMDGCQKLFQMKGEGARTVTFVQKATASYGWTDEKGHFALPWGTVLGFNDAPWEETVLKWYRPFSFETPWGAKTIAQRKIVKWVKEADMWLRPADVTPGMMDKVREALDYYGKGVGLHWYYWHCHPFDSYYPEYFPAQDGFKDMIRESQKMGAHVTPYINGRLWDPATDSYRTLGGSEASCRKADGSLYTEIYSSKIINTVTCPASPIWQSVLEDTNRRILEELGTDGVYMDQIGCAASEACYADNHPHAKGAGGWWPAAYRDLLTRMRQSSYYGPKKAMTTEENAECYMDLFDMMLVVNSPHNAWTKMVPLFPLVYADRCIYSGYTYIPWKLNDGSMNFITMKSLLWGSQLGWVNPELLMRPENRTEAAFLKNLADFRKGQHDLFLGGRFLGEFVPGGDNPVRDIPNYQKTPVVMGAKWLSLKGDEVLILVNMDGVDHSVELPCGESVCVPAYGAIRK